MIYQRVLLLLFVCLFPLFSVAAAQKSPDILILNSYHQGFSWSDEELVGELEVFYESFPYGRVYVEHMDQKRFPSEMTKWYLYDQLQLKFQNSPPDIVIANDNIAARFALLCKQNLWPDVPLIFLGVSAEQSFLPSIPEGVAGVVERFDMESNIALYKQQNPGLKNVFAIVEDSETGRGILSRVRAQMRDRKDLAFFVLQKDNLEEIVSFLPKIPEDSIVLLLAYSRSKSGDYIGPLVAGESIAKASPVPVYALFDMFMGTGVVGGNLLSGKEEGRFAAQMAVNYLKTGEMTEFLSEAPVEWVFDYHAMQRFDIKDVPQGSRVVNKPEANFFKRHQEIIADILSFLSIIIVSSVVLILYFRRQSEQNLQGIFDAIDEALLVLDEDDFEVLKHNQAALHLLGLVEGEDSLGLHHFYCEEVPYKEEFMLQWLDKCRREGAQMLDWKIRGADKKFIWVEISIQYIKINRKKCFVMAVRDVNERFTMSLELQNYRAHLQKMVDIKTADLQSSQKALQKAKTEAIDANNAKSEVIANMSHEMRTPLNGVIGLVQLLERSPLNSEQKNYVSRALTSGKQLLATINDILDFAKMESGSVEIYEESFDLSSVVRTVEDSVFVDPDGGVSFECVIDPDVPDNLLGDQFRLGQVLINLVGNGVKFTKAGRVVLKIDAGKWVDGAIQLKFSVCDNGPGITIEKQKRLFEPYYQGDSSVRKNYGGTGLGLSICKKIITSMDGEIGVKDNPIGGSCFWFEIYLKPSDKRVEEKHAQVPESRGNYYQGKTFLLVEDNEINMYLLRTLLQAGGASTLLAANGQEGLDMLATNDVDLVIMDVQMPVLDGYEATKQIRLDPQYEDLPIIAMTANIFSSDVEKCFDAGMDAYLAKPFTVTDLDEVVRANLKN